MIPRFETVSLAVALTVATVGDAQAKIRNDNGALAGAAILGGALGYLGSNYANQQGYGQPYGRPYGQDGYYHYRVQPYYERPTYYAPPPIYYAPPPPVYYAPPSYVLMPPPSYYGQW